MIRNVRQYLGLVARGFCMGAADIVPGVSGGTMAFILGIYNELVHSIRAYGRPALWNALLRLDIRKVIKEGNVFFLLAVGIGMAAAVLSLSHILENLLETQPLLLWSFFFGLVVASVHVVRRRVNNWQPVQSVLLVVGLVMAYWIVTLVPTQTPDAPWFLVLSGAIAICAMILPGISGSFLLVILGKYAFILNAVNTRDITSLAYVGVGAVCGIILFAQLLSWLLQRYHDAMITFLMGLMLGSLVKIWPWKVADLNVIPSVASDLWTGLAMMALGFVLVLVLDRCST